MKRTLTITNAKDGTTQRESVVFTSDEWELLQRFDVEIGHLRSTRIIRTNGLTVRIVGDAGGVRVDREPELTDLRELLHVLRPLILQDERTHFAKIAKILKRRITSPDVRELIDLLRERCELAPEHRSYTTTVAGVDLSSGQSLSDWLNAYEYHRDEKKRERLSGSMAPEMWSVVRASLIGTLSARVAAILNLGDFVSRALRIGEECG